MSFNGDGDDITLMGENYESFEIRSIMFELPALLHIGGSYDFLLTGDHSVMLCLNYTSNSFLKIKYYLVQNILLKIIYHSDLVIILKMVS